MLPEGLKRCPMWPTLIILSSYSHILLRNGMIVLHPEVSVVSTADLYASASIMRKINNDVILINDVCSISEFHWPRTDANQNHQTNCSQSKSRYNILKINNNKQTHYAVVVYKSSLPVRHCKRCQYSFKTN